MYNMLNYIMCNKSCKCCYLNDSNNTRISIDDIISTINVEICLKCEEFNQDLYNLLKQKRCGELFECGYLCWLYSNINKSEYYMNAINNFCKMNNIPINITDITPIKFINLIFINFISKKSLKQINISSVELEIIKHWKPRTPTGFINCTRYIYNICILDIQKQITKTELFNFKSVKTKIHDLKDFVNNTRIRHMRKIFPDNYIFKCINQDICITQLTRNVVDECAGLPLGHRMKAYKLCKEIYKEIYKNIK